jgi:hypothetical protein
MSRKQLYVDWDTLNKLIKAKDKKAFAMPDQLAYQPIIAQPAALMQWADDVLADDLAGIFTTEAANAKDKVPLPGPDDETTEWAAKAVRDALAIEFCDEATIVVLVIKDAAFPKNNSPRHIHCTDGIGFSGYVKDVPKDAYIVECVDFVSLGMIPVSLRVSLTGAAGWNMQMPMPEAVVEKFLARYYRGLLGRYREMFPGPRYELHYIQMLNCG